MKRYCSRSCISWRSANVSWFWPITDRDLHLLVTHWLSQEYLNVELTKAKYSTFIPTPFTCTSHYALPPIMVVPAKMSINVWSHSTISSVAISLVSTRIVKNWRKKISTMAISLFETSTVASVRRLFAGTIWLGTQPPAGTGVPMSTCQLPRRCVAPRCRWWSRFAFVIWHLSSSQWRGLISAFCYWFAIRAPYITHVFLWWSSWRLKNGQTISNGRVDIWWKTTHLWWNFPKDFKIKY